MWKINDFYYSTSVESTKYIAHVVVNFRSFFSLCALSNSVLFSIVVRDLHKKIRAHKIPKYNSGGKCHKKMGHAVSR